MKTTARQFIDALGGYRNVAPRMGMKPTTLHTHISAGLLPTKLFMACCELAAEKDLPPPRFDLFSFVDLKPEAPVESAEDAA